jgi:hypothetical protein
VRRLDNQRLFGGSCDFFGGCRHDAVNHAARK